ncbi:3-phosphoshikimate 1-carboxyvinyltransferase [Galbibacter orientalis DSM 19592]|uniref:3-phosphoshikimate 1-carboxyvinyltransferase n=1 Tax=Galbibacter orientalis DSM 19592 TaxID=926559 RepID=I3C5W2_9FLAO|nr:3-phosphoshikimate 1-carboxyvinyltransferase [Galbibacter orientalis]EIJ39005.1 3-phosphoshikimate 1-carboxyvinyltransferase [Galbibacter orientalis DSM 19592]
MNLLLSSNQHNIHQHITITGSKSESNRALLLQALYPTISIENLSNSDDSQVMQKGLQVHNGTVDIHHAGTAMRFLTAFFATQEGRDVVLTGSQRMTERPIKILVDALGQLGADITYEKNEGYPPLKIKGKKITKHQVSLAANVSSQYISALLLVAPTLENGLELTLEGKITSVPYIKMTLALLEEIGVSTSFNGNVISVNPLAKISEKTLVVESDWSSASYFYSIASLVEVGSEISIASYKATSLQGDSVLQEIYKQFGVETSFNKNVVKLKKVKEIPQETVINIDLANAPDIAQTIAVSCFGLGLKCELSGLHTLKIKETDRLEALKTELTKLGANISVTNKELFLEPSEIIKEKIAIDTYNDHRMAMAFAPLALRVPIVINDAEVVSKSYPDFWKDMESLKIKVQG